MQEPPAVQALPDDGGLPVVRVPPDRQVQAPWLQMVPEEG